MKKLLLILLLFLPISQVFGQEFLNSNDYVYGCGSSVYESEADSLALLSFSKCVHVNVMNDVKYSVSETRSGVNEFYVNNIKVSSAVDVSGIKKYIDISNGVYTVYYYLNKSNYVEERLQAYRDNIETAKSYETSEHPHAKNFEIGYYYMALKSVSDDLFVHFYPQAYEIKTGLENKIYSIYHKFGYTLSARNCGYKNPSGIMMVRDENGKTLPGFEYLKEGEWYIPTTFLSYELNDCGYEKAKWAYIYTYEKRYRFLFEINTDFGIVRLNVPETLYVKLGDFRF